MSVFPSTGFIAASASDRYFRLMSSAPITEDGTLSGMGEVVGKVYTTAPATTIIPWDMVDTKSVTSEKDVTSKDNEDNQVFEDGEEDGIDWGGIPQVSDSEEDVDVESRPKKRRK
jgi:hypothetical protein